MGHTRASVVAILSGVLVGMAWVVLVDGARFNAVFREGTPPHERQPPYHWYYGLPSALTTVLMVLLNLVNVRGLAGEDSRATAKKGYVFVVITAAIICLGGSIWVATADLGAPLPLSHGAHPTLAAGDMPFHAWPGISVPTSTLLLLVAGLTFFGGRRGC